MSPAVFGSAGLRAALRATVPAAIIVAAALDVAVAFAQATSTASAQLPASTTTLATQLTVTPGCLNKKPVIDIAWQSAPAVLDYALLKSTDAKALKTFKTFTDGTTTYHDTTVTLNRTFNYRVTSSYLNWTGASDIVSVTTPAKC